MKTMVGGLMRRLSARYQSLLPTSHLKTKNSLSHMTAVHASERHTHAWLHCMCQPYLTCRVMRSNTLVPREPGRYLCTDEGRNEQKIPSTIEQSSSYTSCESSQVSDVVKYWTHRLAAAEVPESEDNVTAQHIVAHILGVPRPELEKWSTASLQLTKEQLVDVDRLMACRLERMPLQYIIGEWDFHCLTLKVVPPVFIPRPETEQLVELALGILKEMELESPRILDMCCGSGAISLALLHSNPQVECVGLDQSKHAVQLTQTNALKLGLRDRLTVVMGKVTKDTCPSLPHSTYDLLVSNPPYVLRRDLMDLQPEIMMYEDLRALDGGKDGMDVIKAVVQHAHQLLLPGRKLLLEVDSCHAYLLPAWIAKQKLRFKLLKVHQDFNKKDRFMEFVKKH